MNNDTKENKIEWLKKIISEIYDIENFSMGSNNEILLKLKDNPVHMTDEEIETLLDSLTSDIIGNNLSEYDSSAILKHYIEKYEEENHQTKKKINDYKKRIISYISFLAILITIPSAMFEKAKKDGTETLYKTTKEIVSTATDRDSLPREFEYDYNANTFYNERTYEPFFDSEDSLIVKEYSPWDSYHKQSGRSIKTYLVPKVNYESLIRSNNLEEYLKQYEYSLTKEYTYDVNLTYGEKNNQETIYEIIRQVQDLDDYITVTNYHNQDIVKLAITILTEIFILISLRELSDKFIIEKILLLIDRLIKYYQLDKKQLKLLYELKEEYLNLNIDNKKRVK